MVLIEAFNGSYAFTLDNDEIRIAIFMVSLIAEFIIANPTSNDSCYEM